MCIYGFGAGDKIKRKIGDYMNYEEELVYMETEVEKRQGKYPVCFAYCRKPEEEAPYVEIFIWDAKRKEKYNRFVLFEGQAMEEIEAGLFLEYCNLVMEYDKTNIETMMVEVAETFPKIHMIYYLCDVNMALLHMYYSLTRCNRVMEQLFKAGLTEIARKAFWNKIPYKTDAQNLEEAFGVPMGMLKCLNNSIRLENNVLENVAKRGLLREVYKRFHNVIGDTLTRYQLTYLIDCWRGNKQPVKKLLRLLGEFNCNQEYLEYMSYLDHRLQCEEYKSYFPEVPKYTELEELMVQCEMISFFIERRQWINRHFDNARKVCEKYAYEGAEEDYVVLIPRKVEDIFDECLSQHNCLYQYVWKHAKEGEVIAFVREKNTPEKSLVTIHIKSDRIMEALQKYNKPLTEKQRNFIEKYAKIKGLTVGFNAV